MTVLAYSSKTEGIAILTNNANNQQVFMELQSPNELCLQDVEWIVEDFGSEDGTVPFADFGVVEFTDATAVTISGEEVGPEDATPVDIEQGNVLTSVSIGSSSVTVTYV